VRLTANLTALTAIVLDNIDARTANIDTWEDFDGTAGANPTNIAMYYASTDDNPSSGSPAFTAYKLFTQAEEHARAFKFSATFTSSAPAYTVRCSAMAVTAATI